MYSNAMHRRPYRDVIAGSDTKRLKNQVKEEHLRSLKGRPRKPTELRWLAGSFIESDTTDMKSNHDSIVAQSKDNITHQGVLSVSKDVLLEASMQSLESLGRQRLCGVPFGSGLQGSEILHKGTCLCVCVCVSVCVFAE